ncbi:MAG: 4a-hydroxytetrahydrobiopterin dehydratase [Pseudomonadales bacterium]|jgi:4a-hydroxytetrahydrobiopterin dehydratase
MPIIIDQQQATEMLSLLDGWKLVDAGIEKEFNFSDFFSAFDFMGQVGKLAEQQNHHPDWFNSYNHLLIILTTHEVGGVTERDFKLAKSIDKLVYVSTQ